MTVKKVGQYPSLADIANDEVRQYRSVMEKEDAREFHMAIGLAAHGIGIGSFVYLRRIFERLVAGRYEAFKDEEGWQDEDFNGLRMHEKVKFLRDHLPSFMVENANIFGILSHGIHELDEQACLKAFGMLKRSITHILDEDKREKEKRTSLDALHDEIRSFKAEP